MLPASRKIQFIAAFLLCVLVVTPVGVRAATQAYQPQTVSEQIAYLYGMIAMLQTLIEVRDDEDTDDGVGVVRPGGRSDIDVDTLSATDIEADEAELRGRIDLEGERSARVWFEYGEDNDLDERTTRKRIYDSRGDVHTFSTTIDDLEEDERYYFRAVAEDDSGDRTYGTIRWFTTDDDRDDDFTLSVDDTSIDEGDRVTVDWEIPRHEVGTKNWIGLYREDASNRNYLDWEYLDDDDEGSVTFTIDDDGEYVFRLFLDNSYIDEEESEVIEVD